LPLVDEADPTTHPTTGGEWITKVTLARKSAEIAVRSRSSNGRLPHRRDEKLVSHFNGIVAILASADPEDRKAVHSDFNLAVVCHDDACMQVSAGTDACTKKRVGGDCNP